MLVNGKILDLIYRQTAPETILDILKRNLKNDPEYFLHPKDRYKKLEKYPQEHPEEFLEIGNQPIVDKNHFLDYADTTLRGYSEDEHRLLYEFLKQRGTQWEIKGVDGSSGFLIPLIEFAEEHLTVVGGEPVCRRGKVLDWRDAFIRLGQDIFVNAYLAWSDRKNGIERKDFSWPVILRVENKDLYGILRKGMAENHNHLAGGTQSFQVTWCRMMNYPIAIREELISFRSSNLFSKTHRSEKTDILDKFDQLELAAYIRTILFRALHRNEFSSSAFGYDPITAGSTGGTVSFDGRLAFAQEYVDSFTMKNNLEDMVDCLRNAYGVRVHVLDEMDYCLDYALENTYLSTGVNRNVRILIGERSFQYRCMRACLDPGRFTDFEKEMFYLYLVLQCNFRSEMIQNNEQVGFKNFKNYQDRKDDAWDSTPYYSDAICLALNNRLSVERVSSLEGRMVPKPEIEKNINKVIRTDLAKRFADCRQEEVWDISNYDFDPELDVDIFRDAEWFYAFHYFKIPDDRKMDPEKFQLPQYRHAKHRELILNQTKGFVNALRVSPYFRNRVRGIDAASEEVQCRPEIFAVAYRYIDYAQKKWNASEDGLLPSSPIRISKAYHAGEDFLDIASGLRAIDEAICFLHLEAHSRIGHALALGVEPEIHYNTKHYEIIITKQDRLDDLVWLLYRSRELGVEIDSSLEAQLRQEAEQLFREIYRDALAEKNWDSSLSVYWRSMKLREDDPSVYSSGGFEEPGMDADEIKTCLIDNENSELCYYREDSQIAGLYYFYHFGVMEGIRGNETYIKRVSKAYIQLMRRCQDAMIKEVCRRNLIIETNPSSNVLIGTFKDYCLHPVFRFNNRKLSKLMSSRSSENSIQLNVCVNTDDLGVFDTTLEFEYALLYEALQKRRDDAVNSYPEGSRTNTVDSSLQYSDQDILEYLDDLRKMGIRAVFPRNVD